MEFDERPYHLSRLPDLLAPGDPSPSNPLLHIHLPRSPQLLQHSDSKQREIPLNARQAHHQGRTLLDPPLLLRDSSAPCVDTVQLLALRHKRIVDSEQRAGRARHRCDAFIL